MTKSRSDYARVWQPGPWDELERLRRIEQEGLTMAMNGRQKNMTATLAGAINRRSDESASGTVNFGGQTIEGLQLLKYIVQEVENGTLALRTMTMEMFQEPMDRDYGYDRGLTGDRVLIRGNQFAAIAMEVAPSGRVPDAPLIVPVQQRVNPGNLDIDDLDRWETNSLASPPSDDFLDEAVRQEIDRETFAKPPKAKSARPAASPKPTTPAGASAARDIIFDDDGMDPT